MGIETIIVAGDGFAGHLTALALMERYNVTLLSDPRRPAVTDPQSTRLTGKPAHSHIFLPRLHVELEALLPDTLAALAGQGFAFQPGARGMRSRLPIAATRLFAMRWQLDNALQAHFNACFTGQIRPYVVTGAQIETGAEGPRLTALTGAGDHPAIPLGRDTLVVDTMGARSPVMEAACAHTPHPERHDSHIAYMSQFFRFRGDVDTTTLSEPLFEGSVNFGEVYFSLYPAREGWFSLTAGYDMRNKATRAKLRTTQNMLDYALQSPGLTDWVSRADPVGRPTLFFNPPNLWHGDLFAQGQAPTNLLAAGDALASTNPALGAGCSWAATHARLVVEALAAHPEDPHARMRHLGEALHTEQRGFFDASVARRSPNGRPIPPRPLDLTARPRKMRQVLVGGSTLSV